MLLSCCQRFQIILVLVWLKIRIPVFLFPTKNTNLTRLFSDSSLPVFLRSIPTLTELTPKYDTCLLQVFIDYSKMLTWPKNQKKHTFHSRSTRINVLLEKHDYICSAPFLLVSMAAGLNSKHKNQYLWIPILDTVLQTLMIFLVVCMTWIENWIYSYF